MNIWYGSVMNTDTLARATFVLDRETAERLARISRRMGVSRSALVRDVLLEPVALMAKWVESLPADDDALTPELAGALFETMQLDMAEFIESKGQDLSLAVEPVQGHG